MTERPPADLEALNAALRRKISELDEAHSNLLNLLETTDVRTLFVDRLLRLRLFTPACKQLFRLRDGDIGRPIAEITSRFPDLHLPERIAEVQRTLQPMELVAAAEGGRTIQVRIHPYRTVGEAVDGAVLTFVDVTDVLRAQADSRRLAAIVRGSDDAIISRDLDGTITAWNAAAERKFGWSAADAIGRPITLIVPDDRRAELDAMHARVRRGEPGVLFETVRVHQDGTHLDVSVSLSPVVDEAGAVIGIAAIDRDIGRRVRAERELESQRRLLQLILDNVPVLISYVDAARRYRLVNRRYTEWFGLGRDQIEGMSVRELVGDAGWARIAPPLERAMAGGSASYEGTVAFRLTGERDVHAEFVPDFAPDGRVRGVVVLVQDISERLAQRRALEAEAARKDEFLAMLAHELRNPMGTITNGVALLADGEAGERARVLARIDRQSRHLKRLVDDLLDVSRVTRGLVDVVPEAVDLGDAVRDVVEDLGWSDGSSARTFELGLPDEPVVVRADPVRLAQMVGNLVGNAIKFTDDGGTITCRVEREGGRGRVTVIDDGAGMRPDLVPQVFELFRQGDATLARERGGLGIGLTMVEELTRLHGGEVTAHSEGPGRGTEIAIELPLAEATPSGGAGARADVAAGAARSVLVVDDDEDAAETLALLLGRWGHQVRIALDGEEALELARDERPELVLLDVGLPRIDGLEVARRLRALGGSLSIVMLSGYGQPEDRRRSLEAGADAHLTKPASPDALRAVLRRPPRAGADPDG